MNPDQGLIQTVADAIAAVQGRCSLAAAEAAIRAVEDYGADLPLEVEEDDNDRLVNLLLICSYSIQHAAEKIGKLYGSASSPK